MNSMQKIWRRIIFFISTVLAIYVINFLYPHLESIFVNSLPSGFSYFDVSSPIPRCGRWKDNMPAVRDPSVYKRYIKARRLFRSKVEWQLSQDETRYVFSEINWAADQGDWGAKSLLAYFYRTGLGPMQSNFVVAVDQSKAVALAKEAAAVLQPWGLYDLGVAHQYGNGGVARDTKLAWAYYLKAAELGSAEAQLALADAYQSVKRLDAAMAMIQCAFNQEHGEAAYRLSLDAEIDGRYREAVNFCQIGVSFGSKECAASLALIFNDGYLGSGSSGDKDAMRSMDINRDRERGARYWMISNALSINPDLRFGRLNEFVPLPPADLPPWRGISSIVTPEPDGPPTY